MSRGRRWMMEGRRESRIGAVREEEEMKAAALCCAAERRPAPPIFTGRKVWAKAESERGWPRMREKAES